MSPHQGKGGADRPRRPSVFESLGRSVVKHPWRYLGIWLIILVVCTPAVTSLSSVFKGSLTSSLPSSDGSVIAQNKLTEQFPNASGAPSSSLLLLNGNDVVGPTGQNATLGIVHAIQGDSRIRYMEDVTSLYSAYAGYLRLQASAGLGVLHSALTSTPTLPSALNLTVQELWGPLNTYVHNWTRVESSLPPGSSPSQANWPAYMQARDFYNSSPTGQSVLSAFYYGTGSSLPGFNQTVTTSCLSSGNITPCVDQSAHATLPGLVESLYPAGPSQTLALLAVENLTLEKVGEWPALQTVAATFLAPEAGQPPSWLLGLWQSFPSGLASPSELTSWATSIAESLPVRDYPLPIPHSLYSSFVSPDGSATLVIISFSEPDNYTVGGQSPVFQDLNYIDGDASSVLSSSTQYQGFAFYQTGSAPLDAATTNAATSTLGFLLVLTVVLLVVIMIGYFRAPAAPLVTFTGIGVSIFVTLAALFLVATFVTTISSFLESVLLVFLMAIVTDYSIFMMARYREELVEGRSSPEAVVASVRWAGQSITTSGLTVFSVAIAMVFSGLSFLNELGIALAIAVVVAILMALTVIPSVLLLVGPRVFWPYTKERFARHAHRRREGIRAGQTYFSRAGGFATRRPYLVIALILVISVPVIYVALNVPVSYDLTNVGLPKDNPAQKGLTLLEEKFGQSSISSSFVLVTFTDPVVQNGVVNALEMTDVATLTARMNSTPGIAEVNSLAGSDGTSLPAWLNLSELPAAPRAGLLSGVSTYLGSDARTVQFEVVTNESGYSAQASSAFDKVESDVRAFQSTHPEITAAYFGGAAPTTRDYQALTNGALEGMLIGVSIGIFLILFLLLGAALVPALALGAIGLSILWSWATIYAVVGLVEGITLSFLLPLILIILVLGLGMDYNALLLTRVKEERLKDGNAVDSVRRAVTHAGGVVTAASVILGGPFLILGLTSTLGLVAAIGLGIGMATLLQAFVAQTYLTPAILATGKDKIWWGLRARKPPEAPASGPRDASDGPH